MAMQAAPSDRAETKEWLAFACRHSPYLARLTEAHREVVSDIESDGFDTALERVLARFGEWEIGRRLRQRKQQVALLTALADISGQWPLEKVTRVLSTFAETAVTQALDALLARAVAAQMLTAAEQHGIFILGMGKLGGRELNYSSDIDLIILYEPEVLPYIGRQSAQSFMTRLAQDLLSLLQDRTADGYVFRTDLRLRPDPASTPLSVSTVAALRYYESVGQNWERAAMIKARVVAGDRLAGGRFMEDIQPFLWRTHLDFAAVADILSIKRQMQARYGDQIRVYGQNVKTGRGGIREIEFIAQIHQLIWGGRRRGLRIAPTVAVLDRLAGEGLIPSKMAHRLIRSYRFLRQVEHRLQMIADQQTHSLPSGEKEMAEIAMFLRFKSEAGFTTTMRRHLSRVHRYFEESFKEMAPLGGSAGGKLVFTGVDPDPETLAELSRMGFREPSIIALAVADWHKGNRRCTRTKRSREILTELVPEILLALAETVEPDIAFRHFDQFLTNLPSGVQLFSLFASNRELLRLVAELLGSAPSLGESLSFNPALFDALLTDGFFDPLAPREWLRVERDEWLSAARSAEERFERLVTFQKEKIFQAGVQLLKGLSDPVQAGYYLSDLADLTIEWVKRETTQEFAAQYGIFAQGGLAIVAMGKLGSRELTFGSDLDLIFLYDAPENTMSDGAKPLGAAAYYQRLSQRIVGRLAASTRSGQLYAVDTRLRPFGADGPIAVSLQAFARYHAESAWTFERLALTRARVLEEDAIAQQAGALIGQILAALSSPDQIDLAVTDMRSRLQIAYPTADSWEIKHVAGGLMDIDFLLQKTLLLNGRHDPLAASWATLPQWLAEKSFLPPEQAEIIGRARHLQTVLLFYLRLTGNGRFDPTSASDTLKRLLANVCDEPSFDTLRATLRELQGKVAAMFAAAVASG